MSFIPPMGLGFQASDAEPGAFGPPPGVPLPPGTRRSRSIRVPLLTVAVAVAVMVALALLVL